MRQLGERWNPSFGNSKSGTSAVISRHSDTPVLSFLYIIVLVTIMFTMTIVLDANVVVL